MFLFPYSTRQDGPAMADEHIKTSNTIQINLSLQLMIRLTSKILSDTYFTILFLKKTKTYTIYFYFILKFIWHKEIDLNCRRPWKKLYMGAKNCHITKSSAFNIYYNFAFKVNIGSVLVIIYCFFLPLGSQLLSLSL